MSDVIENMGSGKLKWRWLDGINYLLIEKDISMEDGNKQTDGR